ncbi:hypothetical protein BS50DRAFT_500190 [Corynespora cassiicola Philippines]|uniref:Rhodopsin domain-containing protein n=1 Tax=Corynespora cassiicola Philippines TaxID=1448308 RepID=A0A2T2NFF0_CORCC|nr:hypothetical protein BS50DRAFT_500190 [Corynespora cassiicola Philippines]
MIGGTGFHASTLAPETVRTHLQLVKAHELVYNMSLPFPKLAIICLYFRLFKSKAAHWVLYITGGIIVAQCLAGTTMCLINCRPFYAFWDRSVESRCFLDQMSAFRYYSIPNIATDAAVMLIPLPTLWRLQVSVLAKLGVAVTFLMCTFGIITAVLRFVAFVKVDLFEDVTYNSVKTTSWTIIEPGMYLIAATTPTLRPLIRWVVKEIQGNGLIENTTKCFRSTFRSTMLEQAGPEQGRVLTKRPSKLDLINTIGRKPSRTLQLDDYHRMRHSRVFSLHSDEESMVCADAIIQEHLGRQGRNPDGTLRAWSLQPIEMSPLRTSFFLEK